MPASMRYRTRPFSVRRHPSSCEKPLSTNQHESDALKSAGYFIQTWPLVKNLELNLSRTATRATHAPGRKVLACLFLTIHSAPIMKIKALLVSMIPLLVGSLLNGCAPSTAPAPDRPSSGPTGAPPVDRPAP
jgi:hypothetical protein